ncbi:MAG: pyridoxal phosphate-dependent aminotransferase [Phycisphaerae bacterium]
MRRHLLHAGAGELRYEIREIVELAHQVESLGQALTWENIGDPVQKGDPPPDWIRETITQLLDEPSSWAYCHSIGIPETREFLASCINERPGGTKVTADDILFFNGIGDAVTTVYGHLPREARILGPSPAYSTHSSAEAAHSGFQHLTYQLDPQQGWLPDVDDIRNKCRYNDSIAGILLLSPNNPTGAVYPRELLESIAAIAREYELFLISDETYAHIVHDKSGHLHMSEWIGDVPGLAMRGISKEYPWPGARCGWVEILNRTQDAEFDKFVACLQAAKRLEVSATTLPQRSIPTIMGDSRYPDHLAQREASIATRADEVVSMLRKSDALEVTRPAGGFFISATFKAGALSEGQSLALPSPEIESFLSTRLQGHALDKRFVYYLMARTGIVVVPLSGFHTEHMGFRATLLETDADKRRDTFAKIAEMADAFVASAT